jgi:hypothetical protein
MKELSENEVNFLNAKILRHIEKLFQGLAGINGDKSTYMNDLTSIGKKILGTKYKGTFTSDAIPFLTDKRPYCIVNLDNSHQSGSHWIGIAKYPKKDRYLVYDSFGRDTKKILPSALNKFGSGNIVDTDSDAEQKAIETNCGQRCLAFLILSDLFGIVNSEKL